MQQIRNSPRGGRLVEIVASLRRAERREAVVAHARVQVELVVKIELALAEIALDVAQRLELEARLRHGVLDRQRRGCDESLTLARQRAISPGVQILADRHG